ncbi:M43 family zinc metalloprotease [Flavobacterium sp.]|uniref:M43 family zinc metalloprotease n=1 Tax=Flavobacterium sp. TaxID=239 RepID=UPI0038FCA603
MKNKKTTSIFITILFTYLFGLNTTYGQKIKQTKTLFGKQISPGKINSENGIIRCATTEYEEFLQEKNPKRMTNTQFESWLAPLIQKKSSMRTAQTNAIITIPVVVHVIYNGQAVGTAPNISDIQVESQITVLNQDYRRRIGTPGENSNSVGADTEIEFVLAQQDPNGNPTNGIDRVSYCVDSWSNSDIETILKPNTIWNPTQYLNLWTVQFSDNKLLGYAQFPDGSGLSGIGSSGGGSNTDGVVIRYNSFGSGSGTSFLLDSPYNKGRTTTHEVGHWLGLIHIWGDGSNCNSNTDYCDDTPVAKDANYGCPTGIDSCTLKFGPDMIENYMDYTDDSCMNIFTLNQKTRMNTVMDNSARRLSLKTSSKGTAVALFANDAEVKFESSCAPISCSTNVNKTTQKIIIYNRGSATLTSVTGNYKINGGSDIPFSWTGTLATNKFATVNVVINAATNGTIAITVDKANNVTDQRASNNTATGSYTLPSAPSNYASTNYTFRLQCDYFGSETTWNLKNASGTTLYSSVPYLNTFVDKPATSPVPDLITKNWVLASNQCYTFTINDSGNDGICCGTSPGDSGTGYYDIKLSDGTVVTSGASFKSTESKSFTTNSLFDTTKPTLTTISDRDENIDSKCEFVIPDYTVFTTATDDSGNVTLTQNPLQGTIIFGNGTVQLITLTAIDGNGNSDFITFNITLRENDIYIFPIPAKETINIITSNCILPNSYIISNSLGQIISEKEVKTAIDLTINTSSLSNGIYFISIYKGNEKKVFKFIKN